MWTLSSRHARSRRPPSSNASTTFDALVKAISAGADWAVSSERPAAPTSGKPARGAHDVILVFDGGSRGNPGAGYGSFTYKGSVVRWQTHIEFPGTTTNNQAEYMTMIAGLRAIIFDCQALGMGPESLSVEVRSDSQLVVNQLNGKWKIKNQGMRRLHGESAELLDRFKRWTLTWHSRKESVRILGH